jgi:glycosyltransferase involved in cell wall biosynthesis
LNITHITTDYLPIRGGAELYLDYLINVFGKAGHKQKVFQIDTGVRAPGVYGLPRFPGQLGKNRGFAVWYYQISILSRIKELKKSDALIVHYPFYFLPVMWHPKTVIISHCVEWEQPPRKITHKIRKFLAKNAYKKSTAVVSNDTNFLREMGVKIEPATKYFEEVEPLRWFIPNCVDIDRFKHPPKVEALKGRDIILVPRNSSWAKGIHLALEAFAKFLKKSTGLISSETTLPFRSISL